MVWSEDECSPSKRALLLKVVTLSAMLQKRNQVFEGCFVRTFNLTAADVPRTVAPQVLAEQIQRGQLMGHERAEAMDHYAVSKLCKGMSHHNEVRHVLLGALPVCPMALLVFIDFFTEVQAPLSSARLRGKGQDGRQGSRPGTPEPPLAPISRRCLQACF